MPETNQPKRPLAVIIMAAGQGKRMQDPSRAKVLYPLSGTPLLGHVLGLCRELHCDREICVIGYGREQVRAYLDQSFPQVMTVVQEEQLGTGHAVQQAEGALADFSGDVLVLSGDVPLLSMGTVERLVESHRTYHALATVLGVTMPDPTGYGRLIRSAGEGPLERIVEEKDATPEERAVKEINSGIYVFDAATLFEMLRLVDRRNAQGEYYLTDVFALINASQGVGRVAVATTTDIVEVTGVNTKDQLDALEREFEVRRA